MGARKGHRGNKEATVQWACFIGVGVPSEQQLHQVTAEAGATLSPPYGFRACL